MQYRIKEKLRSGELLVPGDQWPIFFVFRLQLRPQGSMEWFILELYLSQGETRVPD